MGMVFWGKGFGFGYFCVSRLLDVGYFGKGL